MRLVIDFQGVKSKKNLSTRDLNPAWRYAVASSILVIALAKLSEGIALPQISF